MVRKIRLGACAECGRPILVDVSGEVSPVRDECRHCGVDLDPSSIVK